MSTREARARNVDTLGRMLRAGTISPGMHEAGRTFQTTFLRAGAEPLRAVSPVRITGAEGSRLDERVHARREIDRMVDALGGPESPAGSCLWEVLGCGMSLRQWSIRRGMRQEQAQGVLIAALGALAAKGSRAATASGRPLNRPGKPFIDLSGSGPENE